MGAHQLAAFSKADMDYLAVVGRLLDDDLVEKIRRAAPEFAVILFPPAQPADSNVINFADWQQARFAAEGA
jgi:hypothetical protein